MQAVAIDVGPVSRPPGPTAPAAGGGPPAVRSHPRALGDAGRAGLRRARPRREAPSFRSWRRAWSGGGPCSGEPGPGCRRRSVSPSATPWRSRTPFSGPWPPGSGWRRSTPSMPWGGSGGLAAACAHRRGRRGGGSPAGRLGERVGRVGDRLEHLDTAGHAAGGDGTAARRRRGGRPVLFGNHRGAQGRPLGPGASCSTRPAARVAPRSSTADDRGFNPLPLFHINAEVVGLLSTLVAGSVPRPRRPVSPQRLLGSHGPTGRSRGSTPSRPSSRAWALSGSDETVPDGIRFIRSASAPLPVATADRFEASTGIPVIETYGMTEAASQITAHPLSIPRRPGSVGVPVGVELRIVREAEPVGSTLLAPEFHIGHVEIRGPSVVEGYVGDEHRTLRTRTAGCGPATSGTATPMGSLPRRQNRRRDQPGGREGVPARGRRGHQRRSDRRGQWPSSGRTIPSSARCPSPIVVLRGADGSAGDALPRRRRRTRTASRIMPALERCSCAPSARSPSASWRSCRPAPPARCGADPWARPEVPVLYTFDLP